MRYSIFLSTISYFLSVLTFAQKSETSIKETQRLLSEKHVLFQENKGQIIDVNGNPVPSVLFKASASSVDSYITSNGLVYVFSKRSDIKKHTADQEERFYPTHAVTQNAQNPEPVETEWLQVHLEGATILPENIVKERPSQTDYRFFLGHCPNGITGVKEYEKITVKEVYPGIDWVLYGSSKKGMKYDFIVHPGADASQIQLVYEGENPVTLDNEGNIQSQLRFGNITEHAPVSFIGKHKKEIQSAFKGEVIDQHNVRISYAIADYDKTQTLTIDPELVWGTTYGGDESLGDIVQDGNGNLFVTGHTRLSNFPLLNSGTYFQATLTTAFKAFILKFSNSGVLLWATLYGGNTGSGSTGLGIACDGDSNLFVVGDAGSDDFPVQDAGTFFQGEHGGYGDVFILKFDNAGNRLWATYYGGDGEDLPTSICTDLMGNIFITGQSSYGTSFPLQDAGTYFQAPPFGGVYDGFALKFDNNGNRQWATLIGGNDYEMPTSIACDPNGNVFIAGYTNSADFPLQDAGTFYNGTYQGTIDGSGWNSFYAFILKFNATGSLLWGTYYGGIGENGTFASSMAIDATGNVFVSGHKSSSQTNFPLQDAGTYFDSTPGGSADIFVAKFDNTGNLLWGTYYGGSGADYPGLLALLHAVEVNKMSIDPCGNVYLNFSTGSNDIQTLDPGGNAYFDSTFSGQSINEFLVQFTNDGTLSWATYIGSTKIANDDFTIDASGNSLFLVGTSRIYNNSYADLLTNPGNGAYFDPNDDGDSKMVMFKFASVGETPLGEIAADKPTICKGSCIDFSTATVAGATYNWDFGDGATSTEATPTHCYPTTGEYDVTLTVIGCGGSSDVIHITSELCATLDLPNVFTPNGDGENDVFQPVYVKNIQEANLIIVNRWGETVYETNSLFPQWDGKVNGILSNEGVYFWKLHYTDTSGKSEQTHGSVTLIR